MSKTFPPIAPWTWQLPEWLNIGVACTDEQVEKGHGERLAMIVEDDVLGTSTTTYAQLADASSRFASLLHALGLQSRDRVLIRLPNSLAYPTAFFGTMKAGGIAVPTSTLLAGSEVRYLAEDSGASVLVTHASMWPELAPHLKDNADLKYVLLAGDDGRRRQQGDLTLVPLEAALEDSSPDWPAERTRPEDPAYLVYTSGTTGFPKGVLHGHRSLIGRLPASKYWFNFTDDEERILHSGKFNWTYVLGSALMDPLYHGKTVIVHEGPNDPSLWPRLIAQHGCTIFIGVPTIYRQIIQKTEFSRADVPTLRHCMSAGEHLSDEMFRSWRERFGLDVYEAIGMSEISYYISQNVAHPIRPGAAGFPQPGHDVHLLDDDLHEVGVDEEGMICIPDDDPGLFLEYWRRPEETAEARHDGWFFTGDFARRDADGYIWFLGRRDDIINTFGYRVSPHEVERVMKTHPKVADCVAVAETIAADKTLVSLCVIPAPGVQVSEEELLQFGQDHLARYKAPRKIRFMNEFPRTKNGKVLRKQLIEMISGTPS
jgi:acetyl-CoA synthetase